MDITWFYGDVLDKKSIAQQNECEYKQGKAYRYFTDNCISEVYYNNISDESKYCYLRTKCLPSPQRVSSKPYGGWVLIKKDFKYEMGGAILSAYCTCTVGLLGSCNHLAGLCTYWSNPSHLYQHVNILECTIKEKANNSWTNKRLFI